MKKTYTFGPGLGTEGNAEMRDLLGGKGANLAEMANLNLPIPPGFTITTEVCNAYYKAESIEEFMKELMDKEVEDHISQLDGFFGHLPLVSVRSGARVSMPGMMDTILNVGLTSQNLPEWSDRIGSRTALDSYRRLMQMMGDVVYHIPKKEFDDALEQTKSESGVIEDHNLHPETLAILIERYKGIYQIHGINFPDTYRDQLLASIEAVFDSWNCDRAKAYREMHGYPDDWGTAVNVQSMVFGNMGNESCTGVLFSRNPSDGKKVVTGEFLVNAQGEDVVAGIRTPESISQMYKWHPTMDTELADIAVRLEEYYRDMQDIEFTVQQGTLYILQCRNGKRSAKAAFRIASDMMEDGLIQAKEALTRVTMDQYLALKTPAINEAKAGSPSATGIAAGGGVLSGRVVFNEEQAKAAYETGGAPPILVGNETTPDDIVAMNLSGGILTKTGGLTSHAAVVARGMDKVCVVGCKDLTIGTNKLTLPGGEVLKPYDHITIDGATGRVWYGLKEVIPGVVEHYAAHLLTECSGALISGNSRPPDALLEVTKDYCLRMDAKAFGDDRQKEMKALGSKVKGTLYIEVVSPWSNLTEADKLVTAMTGLDAKAAERGWINSHFPEVLQAAEREVVVLLPEGVQKSLLHIPDNAKVIKPAKTLKDLMDGGGIPNAEFIDGVAGGMETYATLKKLLEANGITIASPANPVKEEKLAFKTFG